jgi:hypothetical protein
METFMDCNEIVHIAIAPLASPGANLVSTVATIINKSPYDTRLLLAGGIPKIIAHYDDIKIAESVIRDLHDLGLVAIACRDSELRQLSQGFKAQTLEFKAKEVLFRDHNGREKRIGDNNVFLILEGRIQNSAEVETTKPKTKFSLTRTLLTGGIPMWRKVDEKTKERTIQGEYFARLYDRKSPEPIVDVFQHHMNYSFLGTTIAASSIINFGTVILKLRELFPQAIFDDRLVKPSTLNAYSGRFEDDIEIKCKLIYLFYTVTSGQLGDS